jgi:hypothetical protein
MRLFVTPMIPSQGACDTTCARVSEPDQCRPEASSAAPGSKPPCAAHDRQQASVLAPFQFACNSTKNARTPIAATRLVRVTHPFHPLSGRQLPCVGERYNRYGTTLLLETDNGAACSVLPQWTDAVAPDPEIVLGGERALFRVADLLELAGLVDRLSGRDSSGR